MQKEINISFPTFLADSLKLSGKEFEKEMKMSSLAKLFELGKISSGTAAKVLGLSRVDFLESMAKYKVTIFDISNEDLIRN